MCRAEQLYNPAPSWTKTVFYIANLVSRQGLMREKELNVQVEALRYYFYVCNGGTACGTQHRSWLKGLGCTTPGLSDSASLSSGSVKSR